MRSNDCSCSPDFQEVDLHTCPYSQEMSKGEDIPLECACCDNCEAECRNDI